MRLSLLRGCSDSFSEANPRAPNPFLACQLSLHLSWHLSIIKGSVRWSFYGNCRQLAGQGRGISSHPMQDLHPFRGTCSTGGWCSASVSLLEGFPSTCDGVIISASRPGKAGMIQEQAAADGWDPAVPWDSWWFGISAWGIPAPIHHHSTFPEKEMCPVVGTSSSEGVLQIMRRGN